MLPLSSINISNVLFNVYLIYGEKYGHTDSPTGKSASTYV